MCEVLLRVIDKTNPDPKEDARCRKAGDIVLVREDGWAWSEMELTASFWRIIRIPGMSVEEAEEFTREESGSALLNPYLRRCPVTLNIAGLSASNRNALAAARSRNIIVIPPAQIRAAKAVRPPIQNPNVLGR